MRNKIGIFLAGGAGIAGGKYLFEPLLIEQKQKESESASTTMTSTPKETVISTRSAFPSSPSTDTAHQNMGSSAHLASNPTPSFLTPMNPAALTPSTIANTRTLARLPSTEISRSAHPDDAAKIMDEPLPSSPLIAKKIPSKEDSGEMQAEPYTKSPGIGLFERVRFW